MSGREDAAGAGPPSVGARLEWAQVPARIRAAVEEWLGSPIVSAISQMNGFSPGAAARLRTADGRRVFAKAVGSDPNPVGPMLTRREAAIVAGIPAAAPVAKLLWSHDEGEHHGGWIVLLFEEIAGETPTLPWRTDELERVLEALVSLSDVLTPSPLPPGLVETATSWDVVRRGWWGTIADPAGTPAGLDAWSRRHSATLAEIEAQAPAAMAGETLLHLDVRADNVLLTPDRVIFVDWPHARIGADWADTTFMAPSVAMQGGPAPEALLAYHPAARAADPTAITAVVAAIAGFLTAEALQPPPPGLPTLRAFQATQGEVARRWLAQRTGLE